MRTPSSRLIAAVSACTLSAAAAGVNPAHGFTVNIAAGNPRSLYLQVGVGFFAASNYTAGGNPGNNRTINVVSVNVPATQVDTGVAQPMTSNSTAARSFYDGSVACTLPGQLSRPDGPARLGIVVGKKALRKAVDRNRAKRSERRFVRCKMGSRASTW